MRKQLGLGLALTSALASVGAPAHAVAPVMRGLLCSFVSTNDTTGVVNQDPNIQFGELSGGPVVVVDDAGTVPEVSIYCGIQVNNSTNTGDYTGAAVSAASPYRPAVGLLAPVPISYIATATDNVYLCSSIWAKDSNGNGAWVAFDSDTTTAGTQCSLAISAGA